jgi:hypothetical protein
VTPAQRTAHVAALVAGVDLIRMCWAPSSNPGLAFCGGTLAWTERDGVHVSSCSRCNATSRGTTWEAGEVERLFGKSAAECVEGEP